MDVEYLSNYTGENKVTLEFLNDRQNIKNIMGNDKEDKVEDDSSILEIVSCKNALKAPIMLHIFSYNMRTLHHSFLMY